MPARSSVRELWAQAVQGGRFGLWDLDLLKEEVHYSPQWKARLGFPRIDSADSTAFWRCRVHPADLDPMIEALQSHLQERAPGYETVFRLRSNGSGYRTVVSRGQVVARDQRGQATRMIGTMIDITQRPMSSSGAALPAEETRRPSRPDCVPFHIALSQPGLPQAGCLLDQASEILDAAFRSESCSG